MNIAVAALCSALALWVSSASAQPAGPTDPQIAAIVVTANQVDIDAGKLATAKAHATEVKAFAQQMITDHTGVNKQATELVTKLKVKPEENDTSKSIKQGGDDKYDKARGTFEQALRLAEEAGLADRFRPLIERRLESLDSLRG